VKFPLINVPSHRQCERLAISGWTAPPRRPDSPPRRASAPNRDRNQPVEVRGARDFIALDDRERAAPSIERTPIMNLDMKEVIPHELPHLNGKICASPPPSALYPSASAFI